MGKVLTKRKITEKHDLFIGKLFLSQLLLYLVGQILFVMKKKHFFLVENFLVILLTLKTVYCFTTTFI
jgi:hypothetical protein